MAGHSKWHNIQHRKGRQDAIRGKIFTKAAKEIILATKMGGSDPAANTRLRQAIASAKAVNLPKDKIETAIKKGTGELAGGELVESIYEGYGPSGVAFLVEVATDNKNRSVSEVRHLITKYGGSMGEVGCVSWMFDRVAVITIEKKDIDEEILFEKALANGADDMEEGTESWSIYSQMNVFTVLKEYLESESYTIESAEIIMKPQTTVVIDDVEIAKKIIKMVENLEDNDDVQNVFSNFDIADAVLEQLFK
ncbi:MAG: YebC/PmpR family DNA-binding transcriptional regulator [Desulfovibrionaceae bacterium]